MEKMIVIENTFQWDSTLTSRMKVFKDQINNHTFFALATLTSTISGKKNMTWSYGREASEDFKNYAFILGDYDFLDCYEIELLAGRWFEEDRPHDMQNAVINEAALKQLGYHSVDEALHTNITDFNDPGKNIREIIGVVKNYNQSSLHTETEPIVFLLNTAGFYVMHEGQTILERFYERDQFITVKIAKEISLAEAMEELDAIWKESFSNTPMHFSFLDEQYKSEVLFGKVFGLFSGLAIFIFIIVL